MYQQITEVPFQKSIRLHFGSFPSSHLEWDPVLKARPAAQKHHCPGCHGLGWKLEGSSCPGLALKEAL